MTAGLQVFGSHGVFQIDGAFANLCLVGRETVTTSSPLGSTGITATQSRSGSLPLPAGVTDAVIATRCTTHGATVYWMSLTNYEVVSNGPVGTVVEVYVFGRPASLPGASYLQVFNESGALVFDASRKYMRVVGQHAISSLALNVPYPPGRSYAAVVTAGYSRNYVSAAPGTWYLYELRYAVRFNGDSIQGAGVALSASVVTSSGTGGAFNDAQILVLDVTNY